MRRSIFILCLVFVAVSSFAQFRPLEKRNHNVNRLLKQIVVSADFKTAGFAFYAVDIHSGEPIAAINPDMALRPASTQKLLTTATVLELLGPEHQFETFLEYTGKTDITDHILPGYIIIKGGGDPTLGSKYFNSTGENQFLHAWANAIKDLGIDSITGGVIADARIFSRDMVPPGWSWQNMGNYYGAGACGLAVYDNYYSIYFNTGDKTGDTAEIVNHFPHIPGLTFDNAVTADSISFDDAYIFGTPYSYERYIRGQLPLNEHGFEVKGSMPDPALVAARHLDSILREEKIGIQKPASTVRLLQKQGGAAILSGKVFYTTRSPGLADIITQTNTHSINLFAEHCLIHSGIKLGAAPETGSSADSVLNFWTHRGMDTQGMSLADGSGLSQYNAITPRQMVYLLTYMKLHSNYFDDFYNSMAIAGETGTLKNMFRGSIAEGKLRAKSGTISRVKAYTGYVTSESGRDIAFSMVVNNFSNSSLQASAKLEQLMIALAEFNR
ncbi:MAG: D-alanyl-D-alanine carboxypeptidase/D-alanyl-D-alanine-endopeptidase [Bacteroidales bacterium]|nr:D-alanyl-D-alanine carboxypeptidase/D-alanyl-D-alanine-endopeptidase [Bacteroidales bacterium]